MKKLCLRLLLVLAGLAVLSFPGNAQPADQLIVKVPFPFVAGGRTFPAGEYRFSRALDDQPRAMLLRSEENPSVSVVLFGEVEDASQAHGQLTFALVGDQHVLRRIDTTSYSHVLPLPSADALMAAASRRGATASASSGSN